MDKVVYLVATLHRYQGCSLPLVWATKAELDHFKTYLKDLISRYRICALAEEMSIEALEKLPHPDLPPGESIPLQVARELGGLRHKYCCPPDRAARDKLGLSPDGMPDTPEDNEKREAYWLQQLENLKLFPCLFVLGSNHADSFRARLMASGFKTIVLTKEWKP